MAEWLGCLAPKRWIPIGLVAINNVQRYEGSSSTESHPLELFVKRREFLPGSGCLSRCNKLFKAT